MSRESQLGATPLMSALPPKADIGTQSRNVRSVAKGKLEAAPQRLARPTSDTANQRTALRQPPPFAFASGRISLWNTRKVRIGAGLGSTIELTFLSHALVRLGGASYSILKLILLGWQKPRDLKDGIRTDGSNKSGRVVYRLADFEFVIAHSVPHT